MGTASCRWVRPVLMTPACSSSRRAMVSSIRSMAGISRRLMPRAAAMCMAEGKVSLELWERLTWSLGCRRPKPASSLARWAITSLTFMLDWVPLPVCHTARGNWSDSFPARISSHTARIRPARSGVSTPSCSLALAAAFLRMANASMICGGIFSVPMRKCSRLRWVWAPQWQSAGTAISPMESCSIRT